MKRIILLAMLACSPAASEEPKWTVDVPKDYSRDITIQTAKGEIIIREGRVTLPDGLEVDEASRQFWFALVNSYPEIKQTICLPRVKP